MTNTNMQALDSKNILLVDDDYDTSRYYRKGLTAIGAKVICVDNLQDALSCITDNKPPLDFILIDLNVPIGPVPQELQSDVEKFGDSQGQALGQYLLNEHIKINYRYLSAVPEIYMPVANEKKEWVWPKVKFPPKELAKAVVELLFKSPELSTS